MVSWRSRVRHGQVFRKPRKVPGEVHTIMEKGGASGKVSLACWDERKIAWKVLFAWGPPHSFQTRISVEGLTSELPL